MRPPRPLRTRRTVRWVRLVDIDRQVRMQAARQVCRDEPDPFERLTIFALALEPPLSAGGWVAV